MKRKMVLRGRRSFDRVMRQGISLAGQYLVVRMAHNDLPLIRVGYSVGKKMGTAVRRNRIRRLMRESVRQSIFMPVEGYDIVVVPRRRIADPGVRCQDVQTDLDRLLSGWKRPQALDGGSKT